MTEDIVVFENIKDWRHWSLWKRKWLKTLNKKNVPLLRRKRVGVATNIYSRKTLEKPKEIWEFWKEGFRSCLRIGKVLAPHTPVIRDNSLWSRVQNMTSKLFIFSRAVNCFSFITLFLFFSNRKGCCPCSYLSPDAMRKSGLCRLWFE